MRGQQSFIDLIPVHPSASCAAICGPSARSRILPSPGDAMHDAGLLAAAGRRPAFPSSPHAAPRPPGGSLPPTLSRPARRGAVAHHRAGGCPGPIPQMHATPTGSPACPSPSTRCDSSPSLFCTGLLKFLYLSSYVRQSMATTNLHPSCHLCHLN
jgi:hypothetical protein